MSIGENIRKLRKERGLTQKELGELCAPPINEANIRKYELGRQIPKIGTATRIAYALNVNIDDIIDNFKDGDSWMCGMRKADALLGVAAILADMYGRTENKSLDGKYASGDYWLIGKDINQQFVLYDHDLECLYEVAKAVFFPIVERVKDVHSENEVIQDYMKLLDDPSLAELLPTEGQPPAGADPREDNNQDNE